MTLLYLPDPGSWTAVPVTPRDTLNDSAVGSSASEQQLTVAAENAPLRVIYGQVRIGPQIACVLAYQGALVILAVWGHGEVDSFVDLQIDDAALPASVTFTHYTGIAGQAIDPLLIAAFSAQTTPVTYTDALPGICYSVVRVPAGSSSGFPRLTATIKGRKVWTGAANVWSDNPAFCMADFVSNTVYGMGKAVDWASVDSVAADCDVLVGVAPDQEKLRTLNLALDTVQPVQSWLDTLRTYASCWVGPTSSGMKFVSDKAASVVASFDHDSGQILSLTNLKKRGVQSMPTVMTVTYRDTSVTPHRDGTAVVYAPGVLAGTTKRRESQVRLPGITRYSQAFREATERLNKLLLNDLSLNLGVFDEGLRLEVGDVVSVTHPIGLSAKQVRVMGVAGEYGRYALNLVEYDPVVYSSAVTASPTYLDTNLPNPAAPPAVTGVTMVEEVFQLANGTYSSRWRITWSAATYSFLAHYRAELWIGATLIQATSASGALWVTTAIQEGATYTVKVAAVSSIGSTGAWATQSGTPLGKQLVPGNVPSVSAFEAGGRVYVSWAPAIDIDIWRYEIRYGVVGGTWDAAMLLDRVDALRLQTDQIPVGSWVLHAKAIDSVQQYSATAATCSVTVTSDAAAFLVSAYDQTAPTLTNMAEYTLARTDANRYFMTEDGVAMATKFTAALSTYTQPMATYHVSMASTWLGEAEDFGLLLGGNWSGQATVTDISGSHISYLGHSPDGSAWSYPVGLAQKINARFARLKHEALTTSTLLVTIPDQSIRIDATPREEVGSGTSSASGPVQIVLANKYTAVKKLTITPFGATARNGVPDNVQLGSPPNTTFETDVLGWASLYAAGGTISRYTGVSHSGAASLKFGPTIEDFVSPKALSVTPGAVVSLTFWLYSSVATTGGLYVRFHGRGDYPTANPGYIGWGEAGSTAIYSSVEDANVAIGWQQITTSVTVPAGIFWIHPSIWKWTQLNGSIVFCIDDVVMTGFNASFDVYIFNDAGVKIASAFQYQFQGV